MNLNDMFNHKDLQEIDRRGFLKGLGAAAVAGAAGRALGKETLPAGLDDQDLGDGFIATSVDVAGFTVRAVLDTTTNTYFTLNRRPEDRTAIIRSIAPFIVIRNREVDTIMRVGPKTQAAMKKAGLLQDVKESTPEGVPDVDDQGVEEGSDISGLLAASHLNKSFIITAETAEGQTKKFRVKAQNERVAKEKFSKHHSMAKIVSVKEEGVAETSDYFRRREREEAIISGQKPARKKQPAQTSDYARRREQEKKAEKGVAEGSGKNVVKSVKVGNFRHDLVDTGFGWQVRIYNGDELYDTGLSKNSEQKGLAALDDAVAYTKKQLNIKEQGVAEGDRFDEPLTGYHIVYKNSGNPVSNTPSFETKDQAQKYLMTKMFANHQDFKVVHTAHVGVAEGEKSPMFKDAQKEDRIRSLKNLIAIAKEQGRQLRVQELELELKKLQGVAEGGNDDWGGLSKREFKRREMEHELAHEVEPRVARPKGMYFYTVAPMDLFKAKSLGLRQSRSGKWYSTSANPRADKEFGPGRYWEPKNENVNNESRHTCPECGGPAYMSRFMSEEKDACYHKVRSRYKVWPSAYASGALVQCRKKGAANWGNKGK